MSDEVVRVDRLTKRYGDLAVVDEVSFTVRAGRTLAIVGESGAGKSTVAAILTGLAAPTSGTVEVCGEDRTRPARSAGIRRRRGRQLQLVSQDPFTALDRSQSIGSVIAEALVIAERGTRASRKARAAELLDAVGIGSRFANAVPRALSGGQRQRVAIARALAAEPEVIVLDEAVSALDVSVQAQVLNLLRQLQRETGTAYLFITHDLAVVRQIAHDVLVLHAGKVVEHGAVDDVLGAPQQEYTRLLLDSTPRHGWKPRSRPPASPTTAETG